MKHLGKRSLALFLALVMAAALCTPALAFEWPGAYWPLQKEWGEAFEANDPDRIIAVTQKTYDLLMPYAPNASVYGATEPLCEYASWAYETRGDLDSAILWLERQLEMDDWFINNGQPGYIDKVLNGNARMDYLKAARDMTVYAQSSTDPSPYKVGPGTGVWYGMPAGSDQKAGSAALFYLDFKYRNEHDAAYWVNYNKNTSTSFRQALDGGVIECAFNFEPYELQEVLAADAYIDETMATLGGLNATILLRIGAEVNNWGNTDPDLYIRAFRKVASAARKYSNLQIVYSPDMINNRTVNAEMYYPGDEYVDWVGISVYHSSNYHNNNGELPGAYSMDYRPPRGSFNEDAYYGVGFYDYDPLVAMKHVADLADAHNKPMMISECGFTNKSTKYGDTTAYAADQLNKFYSYLTMVYPQVKAVFYFDVDRTELEGKDFSISGKPALEELYYSAIRENGAYLDEPGGTAVGWEPLDKTDLSATPMGKLRLAVYASFPGVASATVNYYVDGALVATVKEAPYYYDLDTSKLGAGSHTVKVTAAGGQFTRTRTYTLKVPTYTAYKTDDKLAVDGKAADPMVYKINDNNYFRLRDMAMLLNGTPAQFSIGYDDVNGITLTPGEAYSPVGWELTGAADDRRTAELSGDSVTINGKKVDLLAFKIDDTNFFKLRDLGTLLGFTVDWNEIDGVTVTTGK